MSKNSYMRLKMSNKINKENFQNYVNSFGEPSNPYPNEHACRLQDPKNFKRFARVNCDIKSNGKCIDVIYGFTDKQKKNEIIEFLSDANKEKRINNKSAIQAYRYPKDIWTESAARKHCSDHDGILFEPATKK